MEGWERKRKEIQMGLGANGNLEDGPWNRAEHIRMGHQRFWVNVISASGTP